MFQTITAEELQQKIMNNENIHLVDVREPHEHAEFNIGGTLLPVGKIQSMQIDEIEDLRSEEVIVYCRSGVRSSQAAMVLQQLGFTNVYNLTGGMLNWKEKIG
ncbi:MAG: rhodanese-like domain-containing protein [Chitinophagaceae bacterium]|nr:rhodanese-like domain-containing protein [Chitinophagaceae bacterium]